MEATEQTFVSWDGAELFYRRWLPDNPTDKALLLFHRGHEHSGRWQETVDSLDLDEVAIFAWDARGHGHSPGKRGAANSLLDVIKDVDCFARHISKEHCIPLENMIVLAHSLAAVTVTAWIHDYAPPVRAMILATAAFHVKLYVPFAIPTLRIFRPRFVKSYVKSKMLTHDREQAACYDFDPLIFRQIAVNVLLDLHDTAKRLVADAGAIQTPTLMIGAGKDWVVSLKAQQAFFDRLSSTEKRFEIFPRAYHALFHETNRRKIVDLVREFVADRFSRPAVTLSFVNSDKSGYTAREYERLRNNGSGKFALARAGLKIASRLSKGIEIGWQTGFDSGMSLDYVYENIPQGLTSFGRLIDAAYLESIGWRGIRQRKENLKGFLRRAIEQTHAAGRNVHIIDIATGTARYVLETMKELPEISMSALLRDNQPVNIEIVRNDTKELGLRNVSAKVADAFDRRSFVSVTPRATIGIVSGLYELFSSNDLVLNSLRGLAEAIEPGGYLIYTNQPWHPQLEFIARVLRNREGERWIMRRRTTAEMDELVRTAGFEKIDMEVDQWGMFTVSIAQRYASPMRPTLPTSPRPSQGRGYGVGSDALDLDPSPQSSPLVKGEKRRERAAHRNQFSKAFLASAGLSILFLIVYGGCNWITARRGNVGVFHFQWERAVPFVPLLILPYMSIDIFFIAAPFLCRSGQELSIFAKRVATAILVAGACFLIFPLRFAFARPHSSGWTGALFDWFRGIDAPYNLFPSLHATLWLLLLYLYARHLRGVLLCGAMIWFAFIGLSPVPTYQHHVIDVLGGFALAGYCFYFFRESPAKLPVIPNFRIGFYYVTGAVIVLALIPALWPWSALLLWPGIALCIVAMAYFGVGPIIFRKQAGRLPSSTKFVLGPCLFGQYLSLLYYQRQCRVWDEITPCVWIGARPGRHAAKGALKAGVTAVLDLSAEFSETKPFRALCYRNIPILDLTAPTDEQLREMGGFIAEQCKVGVVYVHCKIGYSRSAAAVAAYLIMSDKAKDLEEALAIIHRARPSIVIRPEVISALSEFAQHSQDSLSHKDLFSSLQAVTVRNNRAENP